MATRPCYLLKKTIDSVYTAKYTKMHITILFLILFWIFFSNLKSSEDYLNFENAENLYVKFYKPFSICAKRYF